MIPTDKKSHGHRSEDAEFDRIKRRLRLAIGALVFVTVVGVLGFAIISRGEHHVVDAIYMTVITLTTVGFGEIIDMTNNPAGRIFTVVLLLGGMGIVAYTVPMIAAFLIEGHLHNIFARRRMEKTIRQMSNHYVVCGDSASTWYAVEELVQTQRLVVVVTPSDEILDDVRERAGDIPVISGDPSEDHVLAEAGVDRAAGIVMSMQEDKDNVLGVITARRFNNGARIVAATRHQANVPKLRAAGADAVVSPSRIGGLRIASELVRPKVVSFLDQMLRDQGGSLRVEEITVPSNADVHGRTLGSLEVDRTAGAVLLAVRRPDNGEVRFKPAADMLLEPGLTLIIMADHQGRRALEERLQHAVGSQSA